MGLLSSDTFSPKTTKNSQTNNTQTDQGSATGNAANSGVIVATGGGNYNVTDAGAVAGAIDLANTSTNNALLFAAGATQTTSDNLENILNYGGATLAFANDQTQKFSDLVDASIKYSGAAAIGSDKNTQSALALADNITSDALKTNSDIALKSFNFVNENQSNIYSILGATLSYSDDQAITNAGILKSVLDTGALEANKAIDSVTNNSLNTLKAIQSSNSDVFGFTKNILNDALTSSQGNVDKVLNQSADLVAGGLAAVKDASKSSSETLTTSLAGLNNSLTKYMIGGVVVVSIIAAIIYMRRK